MKLGVKHPWLKYYNKYVNHDPVMTLTKFMARSTWVAHAFEWEKLLKCHLKGKASKKLANGQNIDYSEKRNGPRASSAPALGLNTIIFKHVYWYMQQTQVSVYRTIGPLVIFVNLFPLNKNKEILNHLILHLIYSQSEVYQLCQEAGQAHLLLSPNGRGANLYV